MKERVDGAHHGQKQDGQRGSTTPIQQLVRINGYEVGDHLITTATDQLRGNVEADRDNEHEQATRPDS